VAVPFFNSRARLFDMGNDWSSPLFFQGQIQ
jgi:hypothetical protein